jgi:hypothetical protein
MDTKPNPQLLYTPRALAACEKALRTILKKIGPWGTQLTLANVGPLSEGFERSVASPLQPRRLRAMGRTV